MKLVKATVVSNCKLVAELPRPHGRNVLASYLLWLNCPEIAKEAKPGQFVMVHCGEDTLLPRPFSIHQVKGDELAFFFAVWEDGKGTGWLSRRHKGNAVELLGPLGNGFSIGTGSRNLLLVAGGIGIAPLYFLAQEALKKDCSVTLLYGTRSEQRYPEHKLPQGVKILAVTEDGKVGQKGMVRDLLPDFTARADQVFACGPMAMYRDMALKRQELKLAGKPVQVSLEVRMGCGRGICYGCTVKTKDGLRMVCEDGPVFDLEDISWDELL
ncbi:MAG: dihydroorotate dehydrogenase electron transfer subunit [Chloroflexi bacterium]|nr:dihydroorotate dehydrogenase electron transfer subunit [Chloroflexota bacterium]